LALIAGFWLMIGLVVVIWADGPAKPNTPVLAMFTPGTDGNTALMTLAAADARPLRPALGGWLWLVMVNGETVRAGLAAQGVTVLPLPPMGVVPAGCAGLVRVPRRVIP
jgi:hypothetical protein